MQDAPPDRMQWREEGEALHVLPLGAYSGVWAVALTPDGRACVTAGEDFTARVWDTASGACAHVLAGHAGWVVDVAITPDCGRAITASHDGTARCVGRGCAAWSLAWEIPLHAERQTAVLLLVATLHTTSRTRPRLHA